MECLSVRLLRLLCVSMEGRECRCFMSHRALYPHRPETGRPSPVGNQPCLSVVWRDEICGGGLDLWLACCEFTEGDQAFESH